MLIPFILDYLKHYWVANTRHGTHSPFVYKLLDEVIYDFSDRLVYQQLEKRRSALLNDSRLIAVLDLGAGSQYDGGGGSALKTKRIKDVAKRALKSPKLAQLLYRIVKEHGALESYVNASDAAADFVHSNDVSKFTIVELGTCLGLTTAYLASARPQATIYTIEGCPQTAHVALENWKKLGLANSINLQVGHFDDLLPTLGGSLKRLDVFYVDGNHTQEATLRYFEWALNLVDENSLIIFDDIYWSTGMKAAWEQIKAHPSVTVTIDFFWIGLVYFRKGQVKEHFKIRF